MSIQPRLKAITVHRAGAQLVIWPRALERVYVDDPSGSIAALIRLLADGRRDTTALRAAMAASGFAVTEQELCDVLAVLDELGVLEDARGDEVVDVATRERHQSNLRFYDLFSRLDQTSASFHLAVQRCRVLLLGAGGLGSGILQSLVGLGVGEITVVDCDVVETKNLARQFIYGPNAVGRPKVAAAHEWAAAYSEGTRVIPRRERVTDVASICALGAGSDIIICAIDSPDDIHLLVNEACFALHVPLVAGGLSYSTLSYWSVDPGRTPCRLCLDLRRTDETRTLAPALQQDPFIEASSINRATGPVVQLASGFMAMEAMRYLTRTDAPVAAAAYQVVELTDYMRQSRVPWLRHPRCTLCSGALPRAGAGASAPRQVGAPA